MPRSFVRPLVCGAVVLLSPLAIDAACDDCQRPRVVQFDLRIVPPRPSDPSDSLLIDRIHEWRRLFWVARGVRNWFFNQDPSRECYTHLDGSFHTAGDTATAGIVFGEEWTNLPPATGPAGGDYLVTGSIDGGNGSYVAEVHLQVSKTRETVASARLDFTATQEPLTVGADLARAMGPLLDKIRTFEKTRRAGGEPYALWPIASLVPARTDLRAGESVDVVLTLHDCDGTPATSPLPGRDVEVSATHGTVSPTKVRTDPEGRVHLTFTAGDHAAEAVLTAVQPYRLASEHMSAARGEPAAVLIEKAPSDQWAVRGLISRRIVQDEARTSSLKELSGGSTQSTHISARYALQGTLRNLAPRGTPAFRSEPTSEGTRLEGSQVEIETSRGVERIPSIPFWSRSQSGQSARSWPSPPDGAGRIDFQHFQHPEAPHRFDGSFTLAGFPLEGTSHRIETSCNSEEGCKETSEEGQTSDQFDLTIPVPPDSSGFRLDTVYTEGGLTTTIHEERFVRSREGGYSLSLHRIEHKSGSPDGATVDHRFELQASIEISALDPQRRAAQAFHPSPRSQSNLLTHVYVSGDGLSIDLLAPFAGELRVRLVDTQGRVLLEAARSVGAGLGTTSFPLPEALRNVVVLDLSLAAPTPPGRAPQRATRRLLLPR